MKVKINLLKGSQRLRTRLRRIGFLLQTVSIVLLVGLGIIVFFIFSYSLILRAKQSSTLKKIEENKQIIESLKTVEIKQLLVKQKLTLIGRAIQDHGVQDELVTELYNFAMNRISIDNIVTMETSPEIIIVGDAKDVFELVEFLRELKAFSIEHDISKIISNRMHRMGDGVYEIDMKLVI